MKVLVVPSWYPTEENPLKGIFFKEQAEAMHKQGIDVRIAYVNFKSLKSIFNGKFKFGLTQSVENGILTYRYNTYNFLPIPYSLSVWYYTQVMKKTIDAAISDGWYPQIFHVHSAIMAGFAIRKLSKLYKVPYVITEHSSFYGRKLLGKQHIKFVKSALASSSAVIAVSESLKKDLSSFIDTKSIKVIPNICAFDSKKNINIKNNTNKDKFTFFSLAMLTSNKGMNTLIRAFYKKFKGNINVTLRIGGFGEEFENLKQLINNLGLESQVKLLGSLSRDEVAVEMNNCSCFILASKYETFGIVYIEAFSFGKPVIATRCGGPESFVNNSNGLLVDVDDINGLSNAMVYLKNNINSYNKDSIKKYCKETFGEQAVINQIKKTYYKLIN